MMKSGSVPPVFTVFTPTYNRAHTLPRAYQSLRDQTFRDFEWVIVDDGSSDQTKTLVETWRSEAGFVIRYHWQPHTGRQTAINLAVRHARGELCLMLGSDDACVPEALARLHQHWLAIPDAERAAFSGVTALSGDRQGNVIGNRFPRDVMDADPRDVLYKYRMRGDKWGFQRTDVMRTFPFPDECQHGNVPDGLVWFAIAEKFHTRFVNEVLQHVEYLPDGLSRQSQRWKDPRGPVLWYRFVLNRHLRWFGWHPIRFFYTAFQYVRYSFHDNATPARQMREIVPVAGRLLWLLLFPLGFVIYLRDRACTGSES